MNLTRFEPIANNEEPKTYYPFTIKISSESDGGYDISDDEVDCDNEEECFQRYNFYRLLDTMNGQDRMEDFETIAKELNSQDYSLIDDIQEFKDFLNNAISTNEEYEDDQVLWDNWISLIEDWTIDISEDYNNREYYFQINSIEVYYNNIDGSQVQLTLKQENNNAIREII